MTKFCLRRIAGFQSPSSFAQNRRHALSFVPNMMLKRARSAPQQLPLRWCQEDRRCHHFQYNHHHHHYAADGGIIGIISSNKNDNPGCFQNDCFRRNMYSSSPSIEMDGGEQHDTTRTMDSAVSPNDDDDNKTESTVGVAAALQQATTTTTTTTTSSSKMEDDDDVEEETHIRQVTLDWVQRIVIGLSFCPFAEKPWREQQLHVHIVCGSDTTQICQQVLQHMLHHKTHPGTTLVVCPECHPDDFEAFLQVVSVMDEELIPEYDLEGYIQVASFHPRYEFAGSGEDGIDNWTNRAPYPIFHILREADVTKAVDKMGGHEHATKVWQRNIDLLEQLEDSVGAENVARYIQPSSMPLPDMSTRAGEETTSATTTNNNNNNNNENDPLMLLTDDMLQQRVQELLKNHRFQMAKDPPV